MTAATRYEIDCFSFYRATFVELMGCIDSGGTGKLAVAY
jgi:hypothetical protein